MHRSNIPMWYFLSRTPSVPSSSWLRHHLPSPPRVTRMSRPVLCGETHGGHSSTPSCLSLQLLSCAGPRGHLHSQPTHSKHLQAETATHLFLMCCGEPRHLKLPSTTTASLVHRASHSSMLGGRDETGVSAQAWAWIASETSKQIKTRLLETSASSPERPQETYKALLKGGGFVQVAKYTVNRNISSISIQ